MAIYIRRREFMATLGSAAAAWPVAGLTQTASKVNRIGLFSTGQPLTAASVFGAAILRAFARHGYIPDRNVALEIRASGDHPEQLPQLAKDLVASKVDVILTFGFLAITAAKNTTTTIPIVSTEAEPIATGLVKSLCQAATSPASRIWLSNSLPSASNCSKTWCLRCAPSRCCGTQAIWL